MVNENRIACSESPVFVQSKDFFYCKYNWYHTNFIAQIMSQEVRPRSPISTCGYASQWRFDLHFISKYNLLQLRAPYVYTHSTETLLNIVINTHHLFYYRN